MVDENTMLASNGYPSCTCKKINKIMFGIKIKIKIKIDQNISSLFKLEQLNERYEQLRRRVTTIKATLKQYKIIQKPLLIG